MRTWCRWHSSQFYATSWKLCSRWQETERITRITRESILPAIAYRRRLSFEDIPKEIMRFSSDAREHNCLPYQIPQQFWKHKITRRSVPRHARNEIPRDKKAKLLWSLTTMATYSNKPTTIGLSHFYDSYVSGQLSRNDAVLGSRRPAAFAKSCMKCDRSFLSIIPRDKISPWQR